jgi:hypothetical protein
MPQPSTLIFEHFLRCVNITYACASASFILARHELLLVFHACHFPAIYRTLSVGRRNRSLNAKSSSLELAIFVPKLL